MDRRCRIGCPEMMAAGLLPVIAERFYFQDVQRHRAADGDPGGDRNRLLPGGAGASPTSRLEVGLVQEIEKSTHISEGVVGFLAGLKLLRGRVLDALQAAEFELIAENPEDWMVEN